MIQPDFDAALAKQTQRKAKMRKNNLIRRELAKHPLFADQIIEIELQCKPDYYEGVPDEHDRQVLAYKLAAKINPNADLHPSV